MTQPPPEPGHFWRALASLPLRLLKGVFGWVLALLILFEEWGWEPLQRALAWMASLPGLRWVEARIRALPPYGALAIFLLPTLLLLPVKLLALWLIGQGQVLAGTGVRLADTRKTTPGLRVLEKYAVRCGGGANHRLGLDDAAMLKENHLAWSGGVALAIAAVRASAPWPARVIVEAETPAEAVAAVRAGADAVLLDDFSPAALAALVPRLRALAPAVVLEASGVRPEQLRAYAATGIDLVSTSAPVTRSPWLDLSMRFDPLLA